MDFRKLTKTAITPILLGAAFLLQMVSAVASYEGIKLMFLDSQVLAGMFAAAICLGILSCYHFAFDGMDSDNNTQNANVIQEEEKETERRSLALFVGTILLTASVTLSSLGMFSILGFQKGAETDKTIAYKGVIPKVRENFNRLKDLALKNIETKKEPISKRINSLTKIEISSKSDRRKAMIANEKQMLQRNLDDLVDKKEKLESMQPGLDENLSEKQKLVELQKFINQIITENGFDREQVLSKDEKDSLNYDSPDVKNLYDQFLFDLQLRRPLAILAVIFAVLPDLVSVLLVLITTPRKKFRFSLRGVTDWLINLLHELWSSGSKFWEFGEEVWFGFKLKIKVFDKQNTFLSHGKIMIKVDQNTTTEDIENKIPELLEKMEAHFNKKFRADKLRSDWRMFVENNKPIPIYVEEI